MRSAAVTERRGLPRASNRGLSQREKRINRNWVELLQELRVTQTGVQVLTAFLLTVPFSNRFSHLSQLERITYLCVLTGSIATTALLVAPVAFHRLLFRKRRRPWLVMAAHLCAKVGLCLLAVVSCGVAFLVFDIATTTPVAAAVGGSLLAAFIALWGALPLAAEARHRRRRQAGVTSMRS